MFGSGQVEARLSGRLGHNRLIRLQGSEFKLTCTVGVFWRYEISFPAIIFLHTQEE